MTASTRVGSPVLEHPRCPACLGALAPGDGTFGCDGCGRRYEVGEHPRVVRTAATSANFAQGFDAHILSDVIPALEAEGGSRPAEEILSDEAVRLGVFLGNPVREGRADVARLLPQASGVVLDVGCGLGTFSTAMARGARHVFALDRSPVRAALAAARAAADGLGNVTAIQGDGRELPVGDGLCDLVTVIGVLEWSGAGERDPRVAQRRLLAEVARVLRPGGVLLLGIENRWGLHYLAGRREEHIGLPFASLLPRPLARAYARVAARRRFDVHTHGGRRLTAMAAEAGLAGRLAYPLPSYHDPQINFDGRDLAEGIRLYALHILRLTSQGRRVAARVLLRLPPGALRHTLPSFWLVAAKGASPPAPIALNITGNGASQAAMKVVDLPRGVVRRIGRADGAVAEEPLAAGPNARAWVNWPLAASRRRAREGRILEFVRAEAAASIREATPAEVEEARRQALDGIEVLRTRRAASEAVRVSRTDVHALRVTQVPPLAGSAARWCQERIERALTALPAAREHGDLVLTNMVVDVDGSVTPVDAFGERQWGIVGRDVVVPVLDLLSSRRGHPLPELAAALDELAALDAADRRRVAAVLRTIVPSLDAGALEAAFVLGVLRHCGTRGPLSGVERFLERAAAGELRTALARVAAA